ncbi:Ribokinase-like protein [Rickenella mellea]|uniref:Ribokinase-like protein n=1 Tax=Rickenella mellea TaxID=50990 RepID=A0A4R5XE92_9AGAM|nr:Ribokinase-like protein [Rickenella mellea]
MDTITKQFVTLGMFIIDEFQYLDENGDAAGKSQPSQESQGTYAAVGARIWLPPDMIGMIIDRGNDFSQTFQESLESFGDEMWCFRDQPQRLTTRAVNIYRGDHRGFQYLTPRIRITPNDLHGTRLAEAKNLHFICSPSRAMDIMNEVQKTGNWEPITIYEPIPDRCIPEELPALIEVLPKISILSPNAEEALSLLSITQPPSKDLIEQACARFLDIGVGQNGQGHVVIRSGDMGAYVASRVRPGLWVSAYWSGKDESHVVDVTGAGNSFLGGLAAGLSLTNGDVFAAVFHAAVSASFTIEQLGLPRLTSRTDDHSEAEEWNDDHPLRRLADLRARSGYL